jgi:hypothetical protein
MGGAIAVIGGVFLGVGATRSGKSSVWSQEWFDAGFAVTMVGALALCWALVLYVRANRRTTAGGISHAPLEPIPQPPSDATPASALRKEPGGPSLTQELDELTRRNPPKAVRAAFTRIDQRLQQVLSEAGKRPTEPTTAARARMARTWDLITEQTVRDIQQLAALPDQAKHSRPGVSSEQARDYLGRVESVLDVLKEPSGSRRSL